MQPHCFMERHTNRIIVLLLLIFCLSESKGQTSQTNQFWNEFAFTRSIGKGWSTEANIGQTWTQSSETNHLFSSFAQWYFREWIHFYPSARWKTSLFIAYYDNTEIDGIGQIESTEWRWAFQGVYYINKIGYTLNTRTRIENRGIKGDGDARTAWYRIREQIKFVKPLGGNKFIRSGVWYIIASDEVMFRTIENTDASSYFDRNRLTLGGGYSFTDNFQLEITYANEYIPRSGGNEMYHALQVNFVFNNLFTNLKKNLLNLKNSEQVPLTDEEK